MRKAPCVIIYGRCVLICCSSSSFAFPREHPRVFQKTDCRMCGHILCKGFLPLSPKWYLWGHRREKIELWSYTWAACPEKCKSSVMEQYSSAILIESLFDKFLVRVEYQGSHDHGLVNNLVLFQSCRRYFGSQKGKNVLQRGFEQAQNSQYISQ